VQRSVSLALVAMCVIGTTVQAQAKKHATPAKRVAAARATAWKEVYNDQTVTVALNPAATHHEADGSYSTQLRWTYATDQAIGRDKSYRSMVETRLIDCDSIRSKPVRAKTYTAKGALVSSYDTKPSEMTYLSWGKRKPGSASESAIEGACKTIRGS